MKKILLILLITFQNGSLLFGGVVYEIEVGGHEQSPPKTTEAAVEGRHLKMGIASGGPQP